MRHRLGWNRLNRNPKARKAMLRNLVMALVKHERIMTTLPRAKELRRTGDKVITLAKKGTPKTREKAWDWLPDEELMTKLYDILKTRYTSRAGGYTRVLRAPKRVGDKAQMAIIEYVDNDFPPLRPAEESVSAVMNSRINLKNQKSLATNEVESLIQDLPSLRLSEEDSVGYSSSVDKEDYIPSLNDKPGGSEPRKNFETAV